MTLLTLNLTILLSVTDRRSDGATDRRSAGPTERRTDVATDTAAYWGAMDASKNETMSLWPLLLIISLIRYYL